MPMEFLVEKKATLNPPQPLLTSREMKAVWDVFRQIEKEADNRFQPVSNEPAPIIHRDDNDEPIDVSDIPF